MTTLRTKQRLASVTDWGMTASEISRMTGVSAPTVRLYKEENGIDPSKSGPTQSRGLHARAAEYQGWEKTGREIAADLQCSIATVMRYSRVFGDVQRTRGPRRGTRGPCAGVVAFVESVNWEMNDGELSRVHGKTRERFRQLRKQFNKPASPWKWVRTQHRKERAYMQRLRDVKDWMRYDYEIAQDAGCSAASVAKFRKASNITRRPLGKTDWKSLDWSKSIAELASETGRSAATVCLVRRRYAPERVKRRNHN